MAVETPSSKPSTPGATTGRRMAIGANVALAVVLVVGIVAVVQAIAFSVPVPRIDMTSSGVNSLSEGTGNFLAGLENGVRLTSLYFESDLDEPDQQRYREAVRDLIELYESTNRSKVTAEWINPLKDHERLQSLLRRLREKPAFKKELDAYQSRVEEYQQRLDGAMRELVQSELDAIAGLTGGLGGSAVSETLVRIETFLSGWANELEAARNDVDALCVPARPQYATAVNDLKGLYARFTKVLKDVAAFGANEAARSPGTSDAGLGFLRTAGSRYADLTAQLEKERTTLEELEPLRFEEVVRELGPTTNPLLVETDDDARVVDFLSVWPPMDPQRSAVRTAFKDRAFKGEEALTASILRVTHQEQTAVVFVRFGGPPLFLGGFMPGQPAAPFSSVKDQLERANFVVQEWDLKTADKPPAIEPPPTRTLFVVLKPTPPDRGPFGQPSQEPPFSQKEEQALLAALGDNGRALFVAGWAPGPFGPIPGTYEYGNYLKDTWGITVDTTALLIVTVSPEPGKYIVTSQNFHFMQDVETTEHDIVRGLASLPLALPWCAPLVLAEPEPEGVEHAVLITQPPQDGLWGVKNLQAYADQLQERDYMTRIEGDIEGPFTLAVAATKGDAKVVVVSSRSFAEDAIAFAKEIALAPQGFTIRSRNPGNVTLLVNALHWLNDQTQFMNIGRPIDTAVLAVDKSEVRFVQTLTIFIWPTLCLALGGVTWWIRRR